MLFIHDKMLKEQKRIGEQIEQVKAKIHAFPPGKLVHSRNRNKYKWYVSDGHDKTYIPREQRDYAKQLAWKKYWQCVLENLGQEKNAIDAYLKKKIGKADQVEQLIRNDRACMELLEKEWISKDENILRWENEEYERNLHYPEQLKNKTISGEMVRSKSEAMIAMYLYTNNIPYRYECALRLGELTVYPDFTIRHPKTNKEIYWEHFGLMDDPNYAKNAVMKIQTYTSNGIIPSIQLITTYETQENPLSMEMVEKIVHYYFD